MQYTPRLSLSKRSKGSACAGYRDLSAQAFPTIDNFVIVPIDCNLSLLGFPFVSSVGYFISCVSNRRRHKGWSLSAGSAFIHRNMMDETYRTKKTHSFSLSSKTNQYF